MSTSPLMGEQLQMPVTNAPDVSNLPATSRGPSFQNPAVSAPSKPPSLLASILMGAVHGLAGSAGARSFGAGLAGGAGGELNAQQQQFQNDQTQQANDRANQAANTEDQLRKAQLANAQVQSQVLATQLHQMDPSRPEYVQKFVSDLANQTDEAIKAGANVKTPTFKTAAELQQYLHDNHIGNGDFAVMPKALHDEKGGIVYAGVEFPNSMNTQPVTIQHLGPTGKMETTTIPAGRISLQDYNHAVVAQQQKDVQNEYESYKEEQQNKRAQAALDAKKQSDDIDAQAQLLVAGKIAPSQLSKRAGSYGATLARAAQLDPTFNAADAETKFQSGKALNKDFTSGQAAKSITAFNTASGHLEHLGSLVDALDNGNNQLVNRLGNQFSKEFGGTAITNFDAVREAVAGEVSKTFTGNVATEEEIKSIKGAIDAAQSPKQLRGAIQQFRSLLQSKKEALQAQYNAGLKGQPAFEGSHASAATPKDPFGIR